MNQYLVNFGTDLSVIGTVVLSSISKGMSHWMSITKANIASNCIARQHKEVFFTNKINATSVIESSSVTRTIYDLATALSGMEVIHDKGRE